MADIWRASGPMSSQGDVGTQNSVWSQTLGEEREAVQEDVKHSVCTPSAPGAMHVSPANDGCVSQTPMITVQRTAG